MVKATLVNKGAVRAGLDAVPAEHAPLRDNLQLVLFVLDRLGRTNLDTVGASTTFVADYEGFLRILFTGHDVLLL
jgi:hypothetical protein